MLIASLMPSPSRWTPALEDMARRFPDHEFRIDPETALSSPGRVDAVVASRVDPGLFEALSSLKAIFVPFTGANHLPRELLLQRGVRVFNVHGNAESVAQCALAMTLAFFGRTVEYHNDLREGRWHGFWVGKGAEDEWTSIWHKRCLVLGTGAIGSQLARLLAAFDCPVVGYRRRGDAAVPPHFDRIEPDLHKAWAEAELVFAALPLTDQTRGLVSKDILLSSRGKFLVNVGRGPVVDEEGLYLALRDGILRGAAIDTWYRYPEGGATTGAPSRFPIHELPNVLLSPHIAGSTAEANQLSMEQTMENLASWLETGRCAREVDLRELY